MVELSFGNNWCHPTASARPPISEFFAVALEGLLAWRLFLLCPCRLALPLLHSALFLLLKWDKLRAAIKLLDWLFQFCLECLDSRSWDACDHMLFLSLSWWGYFLWWPVGFFLSGGPLYSSLWFFLVMHSRSWNQVVCSWCPPSGRLSSTAIETLFHRLHPLNLPQCFYVVGTL